MSGPRIVVEGPYGDGFYGYKAKCCGGYRGEGWLVPEKAQEDLASHLNSEHGIVKDPSALVIDEGL